MQKTTENRLSCVINELNQYNDFKSELSEILRVVARAIGAQAGTFWFYHRFGDGLIRPMAVYGSESLKDVYLLPGEGIAGQVIDKEESIVIRDCQTDPGWTKKVDLETGFVTKTTVCVPVRAENLVFGSIQLVNKIECGCFEQEDMEFLERIAEHISQMMMGDSILGEYNSTSIHTTLEKENDAQRMVIKRLSTYIDHTIINEILRKDGKHKKSIEPQDAVVLFADIRGFTGLAQSISSTQLISMLSDFLALTSYQIRAHHGVIDKFMGDSTMAYWICEEVPDAALAACRCAMAIQQEAKMFTERLLRQIGIEVGIGIGVHKGPVLLCHVGDEQYMAYTVIGSSVNTACRIEEQAPAGAVYISEDVANELGELCKTTPTREEVQWHSKDDKLIVLELKALEV